MSQSMSLYLHWFMPRSTRLLRCQPTAIFKRGLVRLVQYAFCLLNVYWLLIIYNIDRLASRRYSGDGQEISWRRSRQQPEGIRNGKFTSGGRQHHTFTCCCTFSIYNLRYQREGALYLQYRPSQYLIPHEQAADIIKGKFSAWGFTVTMPSKYLITSIYPAVMNTSKRYTTWTVQ